jgi:glycosyltransferase involved in cell wall biosynthesis
MAPTVLVNAGPWLPVPPNGYGGIENVLATLIPPLRERGVRVVLCAARGSALEVDRRVETLPPMFEQITAPYNQAMGIAHAHMASVVAFLRDAGEPVDLVHDHLEVVGPAVLAAMGDAAPPVLQTLHWDLGKHRDFYAGFEGGGRVWFTGVSEAQMQRAPAAVRRQALAPVPLAVPLDELPFSPAKGDAFLALGRIAQIKGQDVAARACRRHGWRLDLVGPVAGLPDAGALERALGDGDQARQRPDVRFFLDHVRPELDGDLVRWIGSVAGARKAELLGRARAMVCPIRWEEPGGTAVCEALACGTPVIGFRRGVLPALVEDGVTGFLVDDEPGLERALARAGELDPAACRRAAEERFSPAAMADAYLQRYADVLAAVSTPARPG